MKYPNKIKKKITSNKLNSRVSFKNKGDNLEYDLNLTNHYYLQNKIAVIHKKPTPIKVVDINKERIITKAFFQTPSTTDYNGIYKGMYIDFEAKETASTTSFALSNIHSHQINHLIEIDNNGGIAFVIVLFINLNEVYVLPIRTLTKFINNNDRKSIPIKFFRDNCHIVDYSLHPRLDYLKVIDWIITGGKNEK